MAKPRKNAWESLTPEEKAARVKRMLAARAKGKKVAPVIVRPKEIEEVQVSPRAPHQSDADVLATLIIAVAKQISRSKS